MNIDRAYIEANSVVDRYVVGQLTDEEAEAFEEMLLWSTETREEVLLAEQLRNGLRDAVAAGMQPRRRLRAVLTPSLAAAAVSAAVAVGVTLMVADTGMQPTGFASTNVYELAQMRSAPSPDDLLAVDLGASKWVTLNAYPNAEDFDEFRVFVERSVQDGWVTVFTDRLPPGDQELLAVYLPSASLRPGVHRLRVEGSRDGQFYPALTVGFRVVAPSE